MDKSKIKLADNLKKLSKERELSITTIASKAKMNIGTLHNYFNGTVPSHIISMKRVAELFDTTIDELLFERKVNNDQKSETNEEIKFEIVIKKID